MKSGFYLRVERNGKWYSLDITQMTRAELAAHFETREKDELIRWIAALAEHIASIEVIDEEEQDD